jgi:hypothetical protein
MQDLIGYDEIIENSMRSVIYHTLKKIEKSGLPGNHYFVVTFLTKCKGVKLSQNLVEKYPEEMTIALQHQFKDLIVKEDEMQISLSFSGNYEKMTIPYRSITSFNDPSINFGLKFSNNYTNSDDDDFEFDNTIANQENTKNIDLTAKVISLDDFRKIAKKNNDEKS